MAAQSDGDSHRLMIFEAQPLPWGWPMGRAGVDVSVRFTPALSVDYDINKSWNYKYTIFASPPLW
ncbi:MAG: hypothetical protein WA888_11450 [Burkholderiaceae bacterium]